MQCSGHGLQRFAVITASIGNPERRDRAFVVDERMELEVKEPTGHGEREAGLWSFISGPCCGKLCFPASRQLKAAPKHFLLRSPWHLLLLPLLLVLVFWGGQLVLSPEARNRFIRPGNMVLLGIDPIGANADVVVAVRLQGDRIRITQIPRDTFTYSEALGSWKIGELYGLAGPEAVQEEVAALMDADFPYLVVIHGGVVAALVDALGGLTITVPTRMVYDDQSQGLFIDLKPGRQRLNGQQVEHFVRWRGFYGDIGRLERRQEVINALDDVFKNPGVWARLPMLKQVLEDEVKAGRLVTNLDLQALPIFSRSFASRGATIETLPGREDYYKGLSYWFAEQGALPSELTAPPQQDTWPSGPAALPQQDTWPSGPAALPRQGAFPPGFAPSPPQDALPLGSAPPPVVPPPIEPVEYSDHQTGEP